MTSARRRIVQAIKAGSRGLLIGYKARGVHYYEIGTKPIGKLLESKRGRRVLLSVYLLRMEDAYTTIHANDRRRCGVMVGQ